MKLINTLSKHLLIIMFLCPQASYAQDYQEESFLAKYYTVSKGETLYKIASSFDIGIDEILQANPDITDLNFIYAGQEIILPTRHLLPEAEPEGILINLAELRLYFFSNENITSFPITIGADEKTPIGKTKIIKKRENPYWIPPDSIRQENPELPEIVPPGPDNPLGNYAMYLDASHNLKWQRIMIHGTNASWTIGSRVSHGCIRLYPRDIEKLFNEVEIGTPLVIVDQPIKILELNNKIYLEAHLKEAFDLEAENLDTRKLICQKVENCESRVSWHRVESALLQNLGVPMEINK